MLKIKCISTGSTANCYLLNSNGKILILDFGIKYNRLITEISDFNSIVGGVLSHQHTDHNAINGSGKRTVDYIRELGINVLTPDNCTLHKIYTFGDFKIIPVESKHNIKCYGYIILTDNTSLYFATDTSEFVTIENPKIDNFIIECNYCNNICIEKMLNDETNQTHLANILKNHCGLNYVAEYMSKYKEKCKNLITIHKSNGGYFNSRIVSEHLKMYADHFYIAENGKEYTLKE